jgi:acyl transferase domain-containing protein
MASNDANCARFRESMLDTASGAPLGSLRADFDAHARDCAACREEFQRVQALLRAIDDGVRTSLAVEPSPQLVARVRQQLAAQSAPAPAWWSRNAWLAAAGACAALAILLLVARTLHRFDRPHVDHASSPVAVFSTPSRPPMPPNRRPVVESARTIPPRNSALMLTRHSSRQTLRPSAPEPQVIVEPGQMQTILHLVAAMQRGQIDGAKLLAGEKKVVAPLKIQPLTIAPLQIATLKDESEPSASSGSGDDSKNFVNGRSN